MQGEYLKHFLVAFKKGRRSAAAPPKALRLIGSGNWLRSVGGGYFFRVPPDSPETAEALRERLMPLLRKGESVTVIGPLSPTWGAQAHRLTWEYLEDHFSVKGRKRAGMRALPRARRRSVSTTPRRR